LPLSIGENQTCYYVFPGRVGKYILGGEVRGGIVIILTKDGLKKFN
jgi:hypothetical protein